MAKKVYDFNGEDRQDDSVVKISFNKAEKFVIFCMIFFMIILLIIAVWSGVLLILDVGEGGPLKVIVETLHIDFLQ